MCFTSIRSASPTVTAFHLLGEGNKIDSLMIFLYQFSSSWIDIIQMTSLICFLLLTGGEGRESQRVYECSETVIDSLFIFSVNAEPKRISLQMMNVSGVHFSQRSVGIGLYHKC